MAGRNLDRYGLADVAAASHRRAKTSVASSYFANDDTEFDHYPVAIEHIKKLMPEIARITKRPVRFVGPDDVADRTEKYGRIRILLSFGFTTDGFQAFSSSRENLWGGVPIGGPYSRLGSFFLPDADNAIGLAVCQLGKNLSDDMTRARVTACPLRSLGLPEILKSKPDIVLSARIYSSDEGHPQAFTTYDRMMLALLYCDDIKQGMDKNQVIDTLMTKPACLQEMQSIAAQ